SLKRRYGLGRTPYRGLDGCWRWVGGTIRGSNLNRVAKLICAKQERQTMIKLSRSELQTYRRVTRKLLFWSRI
ncbi:MAG: hypothetical protein ACPLRH_05305, partial [Desulfotomaculales bacterium]